MMIAVGRIMCATLAGFIFLAFQANGQQLTPEQVAALPECSLSKVNDNCKLIIDRHIPLSPSALQMYSATRLTVIVKNPNAFERYFLDLQPGTANLTPDVASSIVTGLMPSLPKVGGELRIVEVPNPQTPPDDCVDSAITGNGLPNAGSIAGVVDVFRKCVAQIAKSSIHIYQGLEPYIAPDSITPKDPIVGVPMDEVTPIDTFLQLEFGVSGKITAISGIKPNPPADKNAPPPPPDVSDARAVAELGALQKLIDAIATDLLGYKQRISDLADLKNGGCKCADLNIPLSEDDVACVSVTSKKDDPSVYHNMVVRTVNYSLNSYNLVSYAQEAAPDPTKKQLRATITINFADTPTKPSSLRWEASAGAFFSTLPIRSFTATPVFTSGVMTDNTIVQNKLYPTVVPFAAANYRLSNDLNWTRWKSAIYWTGAVGVNPNTTSADFASGLSLSWRGLMLSGLWHFGHDVRLTQGLEVGESLGAAFKGSLATQNYWTSSFAIGLSVRVPALTGR